MPTYCKSIDMNQPKIDNTVYDNQDLGWWGDDNYMALLRTAINPCRFAYFNKILSQKNLKPKNLKVLDVGCGGGILTESFRKIGCHVTGIDVSQGALQVAIKHAATQKMNILYLSCNANNLPFANASFDIVTCCDVLEHVDSVNNVVAEISRVLKRNGILFYDTINRTYISKIAAIKIAQDFPLTAFMPRNLHVWHQFITPGELNKILQSNALQSMDIAGITPTANLFSILIALIKKKFGYLSYAKIGIQLKCQPSKNLSISYMGYCEKTDVKRDYEVHYG
jgi:2-polyprenyl-6-hydroxyphenyl methylase/3-demethylubiquinone-9 3-methyltransferase